MSTDKNNLWIETEDGLFVDPAPALQSEMNRVLEGWEKRIEQAQECAGTQNKMNNSERSELKDAALAALAVASMRVRMTPHAQRKLRIQECEKMLDAAHKWAKSQKWILQVLNDYANHLTQVLSELPSVPTVNTVELGKPQLVRQETLDDAEIAESRAIRVDILQQLDALLLSYATLGKVPNPRGQPNENINASKTNVKTPEALMNLTRASITSSDKFTDLHIYLYAMKSLCAPRIFVPKSERIPHPIFKKGVENCVSQASRWIATYVWKAQEAQEASTTSASESDDLSLSFKRLRQLFSAQPMRAAADNVAATPQTLRWNAQDGKHFAKAVVGDSGEIKIIFMNKRGAQTNKFDLATVLLLRSEATVDDSTATIEPISLDMSDCDEEDCALMVDDEPWWLDED